MADNNRIHDRNVEINAQHVQDFFYKRAISYSPENPLTSVLYQDKNPEVAKQRDAHEKNLIAPMLLGSHFREILDVGCGIGRWADVFVNANHNYHGVDNSPALVDIAKNRFIQHRNIRFYVAPANGISNCFSSEMQFDVVIVSGLLLYINDEEVLKTFADIKNFLSPTGIIYIREPLAISERLTLKDYYSEELNEVYNAIYRSVSEMETMLTHVFAGTNVSFPPFMPLYVDDTLNNRVETKQFYTISKRT